MAETNLEGVVKRLKMSSKHRDHLRIVSQDISSSVAKFTKASYYAFVNHAF